MLVIIDLTPSTKYLELIFVIYVIFHHYHTKYIALITDSSRISESDEEDELYDEGRIHGNNIVSLLSEG